MSSPEIVEKRLVFFSESQEDASVDTEADPTGVEFSGGATLRPSFPSSRALSVTPNAVGFTR